MLRRNGHSNGCLHYALWPKTYISFNIYERYTAELYQQPNKLTQLQKSQLNLLTVTFLAIYRWIEINLRWLIVYGSVKRAKDARLLLIRSRNQLDGLRPLWRPSLFLPAPETNQCWIRGLRSWEKDKYMLSVGCEIRMVKKGLQAVQGIW